MLDRTTASASHSPPLTALPRILATLRTRIGCHAAAFVPADRGAAMHVDCETDASPTERLLGRSRKTLFALCPDGAPAVRNKVRGANQGPLLCRLLLIPMRAADGSVPGLFVLQNSVESNEFTSDDVRTSEEIVQAHLTDLQAAASVDSLLKPPADPVTDDDRLADFVRGCLQENRVRIFGQPIAPLAPGERTRRYEMLARLLDDKDRLVLPQQFLSSATRHHLLPQLDRHVIEQVLAALGAAQTTPGFKAVDVSINLSGPTLADATFADWLINRVRGCRVPVERLGFEIAEHDVLAHLSAAQTLCERLRALGCKVAVANFGTASLGYLRQVPLTALKIDAALVAELDRERTALLVRGIAQLAHTLGLETIAEHVETPAICMRLIELGVQFGQGFAIGEPVLLDRILDPVRSLALAN